MIKKLNKNIDVNSYFEERLEVELEERVEMGFWSCDCDGKSCKTDK